MLARNHINHRSKARDILIKIVRVLTELLRKPLWALQARRESQVVALIRGFLNFAISSIVNNSHVFRTSVFKHIVY